MPPRRLYNATHDAPTALLGGAHEQLRNDRLADLVETAVVVAGDLGAHAPGTHGRDVDGGLAVGGQRGLVRGKHAHDLLDEELGEVVLAHAEALFRGVEGLQDVRGGVVGGFELG